MLEGVKGKNKTGAKFSLYMYVYSIWFSWSLQRSLSWMFYLVLLTFTKQQKTNYLSIVNITTLHSRYVFIAGDQWDPQVICGINWITACRTAFQGTSQVSRVICGNNWITACRVALQGTSQVSQDICGNNWITACRAAFGRTSQVSQISGSIQDNLVIISRKICLISSWNTELVVISCIMQDKLVTVAISLHHDRYEAYLSLNCEKLQTRVTFLDSFVCCHWIYGHSVRVYQRGMFYMPVFRREVLWYDDVHPSLRLSVRPGLRHPVRQSQFLALFSYMLSQIELKFAYDFILRCYRSSSGAVTLCQVLEKLCLILNLEYRRYLITQ